ncbi:helix-turn-helix domain-containing protein, partial [Thiolapillus sp.]|uniref:helix-turn-helix domain-containing protein n=4 Tax=Thiolapillus sp. TaxID=2017437 RepID=UPI003AF76568
MSILARDWAYSQALAAPAKPVLVALAEHVSGEGRACWPSVSRLARMTGYAERTVRRALRALEAAGLVRIEGGPAGPPCTPLTYPQLSPSLSRTKSPVTPPPRVATQALGPRRRGRDQELPKLPVKRFVSGMTSFGGKSWRVTRGAGESFEQALEMAREVAALSGCNQPLDALVIRNRFACFVQ